jgi:phosphoribosylaminoimidazole (AIR) synthetase
MDRIRRVFRQGMRVGLASPYERALAHEDLQKRLVRAINKVIELYDYGCCLDVIQPNSDLEQMLQALQEQLSRVSDMGKIRPRDITIK